MVELEPLRIEFYEFIIYIYKVKMVYWKETSGIQIFMTSHELS